MLPNPYLPIFALGLLAFLFACVSVTLATLIGPKRYNRAKRDAYECGIDPTPQPIGGGHFTIKYYLTAMLFIVSTSKSCFSTRGQSHSKPSDYSPSSK